MRRLEPHFSHHRHILPLRKMKTAMSYMDFTFFILIMLEDAGTSAMQVMRFVLQASPGGLVVGIVG